MVEVSEALVLFRIKISDLMRCAFRSQQSFRTLGASPDKAIGVNADNVKEEDRSPKGSFSPKALLEYQLRGHAGKEKIQLIFVNFLLEPAIRLFNRTHPLVVSTALLVAPAQ